MPSLKPSSVFLLPNKVSLGTEDNEKRKDKSSRQGCWLGDVQIEQQAGRQHERCSVRREQSPKDQTQSWASPWPLGTGEFVPLCTSFCEEIAAWVWPS